MDEQVRADETPSKTIPPLGDDIETLLRITKENDALRKAFTDAFRAADDAKKNSNDDAVIRQTAHEMAVAFEAWWDKDCSFTALNADPAEVYEMLASQKAVGFPEDRPKPYTFGPDFRSGNWYGTPCHFTPTQAEVVRLLLDGYESGAPDVDAEMLVGGDAFTQEKLKARGKKPSAAKRVRDIFRYNSTWGTMIVSGGTRGTYCLAKP